jgi:cytochrome c553
MRRFLIIVGCLLAMAVISRITMELAYGQAAAVRQGDAKRGAQIAAEGTEAGAPACVSCHAVGGNPDGSGSFPRLFGLPRDYMVKQLQDYAAKRRTNDIMSAVAQSLSEADALDVSAYYAAAKEPWPKLPPGDKGLIILGEKLAFVGDGTKAVPGCNNCHGPGGAGEPPTIPYLAGQFAPYLSEQLALWKKGGRNNDGGAQMAVLAKRMSDQDMAAVAAFYQQARMAPPPPLPPPGTPSK